jgi:predicted RNA-binding Zn-ribbon protein involved in translation (DUF1610 family)
MELIKENYDLSTVWNCPICGETICVKTYDDVNDNGTQLYFDWNCPECGAMLTLVADVSHVCVWKEE